MLKMHHCVIDVKFGEALDDEFGIALGALAPAPLGNAFFKDLGFGNQQQVFLNKVHQN